jgi:two-component system LytT family response regulator
MIAGGTPLRVAIADDEPLARAAIRAALAEHPSIDIVGEAADGDQAVALLRSEGIDAVFLDIRMPGLDGFDVLLSIDPGSRPAVVFVTAFDDHAVRAFDVHAVDYLVKPFDDERFAEAVRHVRERVEARRRGGLEHRLDALLAARADLRAERYHTRIQVREGAHIRFVSVDEVRYVQSDGNHLHLHLSDGGTARIRRPLKELMGVLDPTRFVRIHRSTAVNLDFVREVQPWFSGDYVALMKDGEELRVSRHYRDRLLRASF